MIRGQVQKLEDGLAQLDDEASSLPLRHPRTAAFVVMVLAFLGKLAWAVVAAVEAAELEAEAAELVVLRSQFALSRQLC